MNMNPDQIAEVRDYMIEHRDQFRTFADSDSDTINLFKSGEIVLTDGGLGTTTKLLRTRVSTSLGWRPKRAHCHGSVASVSARRQRTWQRAYAFINHYLSPEMQAVIASQGFSIVNPKAMPLIPKKTARRADPSNLAVTHPRG